MATGGARRFYEEDSTVDDYLLNQVSKWVLYNRLPALARNLRFSQAEITRIVLPGRPPEEHVFKVTYHVFLLFCYFVLLASQRGIFIKKEIIETRIPFSRRRTIRVTHRSQKHLR